MDKFNLKIIRYLLLLATLCIAGSAGNAARAADVPQKQGTDRITGSVRDSGGNPLPGASVVQKGTTNGVSTDMNGNFTIPVTEGERVLIVSYIGYVQTEVPIGSRTVVDIVLDNDATEIEEIAVVAYGTQKKETLTGAISSVGTDELLRSPNSSVANSLAGMLTGVTTVQSSGQPGAEDPEIYVRGMGTLTSEASTPLILVDGVEMSFFQMDANEIESITILKDASATAVFGVRGANGVILVTTRRGAEGRAKISVSSSVGLSRPTRMVDMAGSYQYALMYNEMETNDGKLSGDLSFSPRAIDMFRTGKDPIMYPDTDWRDYMFRSASVQTQHNINISGGTNRVRYFASVSYLYQNGLLRELPGLDYDGNFKYQRYNYRANLDLYITKTTLLKVNIGGIIGITTEPLGNSDGMWKVLNWSQPFSSPGIVDGKVIKNDDRYFGNVKLKSGLEALYGQGYETNRKNTMNMNLEVVQKLDMVTKGLSFRIKGAYNTNYEFIKTRPSSKEIWTPFYRSSINGSGLNYGDPGFDDTIVYRVSGKDGNPGYSESDRKKRDWYLEGSFNYARKFNSHNVSALLLYNQSKTYYPKTFTAYPSAYVGLVGRVTYDYKSKYLAEFNIGYNGSENFAPDKRFGVFPAGSVGWIITQEEFMKNQKVVNYLKLRASVGLVGNDNLMLNNTVHRYLYLPAAYNMNQGGYSFGFDLPQNERSAAEARLGNPNVTWEKALKQNYGIDAHFLNNRLKVSVDYFREYREDILINRKTVPSILGLGTSTLPAVNLGEVRNQGYEIEVKWAHKHPQFRYWVNANMSYSRNKIMFMDEIYPNEPYMVQTGRPTGIPYGYVALGFYTEDDFEDAAAGKLKPEMPDPGVRVYPGDVKYKDMNKDNVINSDDQTYRGYSKRPEYIFGLNYGVEWKGFDLSMNWTAATNTSIVLEDVFRQPFGVTGNRALMKYMANERWTHERAGIAKAPRFSQNSKEHNYKNSTLWVRDASYIRLKNVKLGYTFANSKFLGKMGISNLNIYVSGYNLLTFDRLKIIDPESKPGNDDTYPVTQIYNFGLNITF